MRFREFSQRRKEQQVDEFLPALAAAGGALARGAATVGGAALRGAGNLAVQGAKAIGNAAVQGVKTAGQAVGNAAVQGVKAAGQAAGQAVGQALAPGQKAAPGQQGAAGQQPIPLKVGTLVPMANPIGKVKVNKIEPHSVTLDTQQKLGMNLKVDPAELGNYMQTLQGKASGQ
jgi:hypothetical protein